MTFVAISNHLSALDHKCGCRIVIHHYRKYLEKLWTRNITIEEFDAREAISIPNNQLAQALNDSLCPFATKEDQFIDLQYRI